MQVAQLAVHPDDAHTLLTQRNELSAAVLEKYHTAGQVAQLVLQYVLHLINTLYHHAHKPMLVQHVCLLGDSYAAALMAQVYTDRDAVREKGIANPVTLDVNSVQNFLPGLDSEPVFLAPGDVVRVAFGAHVDGYAANAAHTVAIHPPGVAVGNEARPAEPVAGAKADALVAAHVATEAVVALLALALTPEKLAAVPHVGSAVTGAVLRDTVDGVAACFGCVPAPGLRVRRVRRFLAGQAEGIVAERDFKGVVWEEGEQEKRLLQQQGETRVVRGSRSTQTLVLSAVPSDDFAVAPGEVYAVDLTMCAVAGLAPGLVTLQEVDSLKDARGKPAVYVRDVAVRHSLKLALAQRLVQQLDRDFSVFPFKAAHACELFPVDPAAPLEVQIDSLRHELRRVHLGLTELANKHMARARPVQTVRHLPWAVLLTASNATGRVGSDAAKLVLPGKEVPLPQLGIALLRLRTLLKHLQPLEACARECATVVLDNVNGELLRLTGGSTAFRPLWAHSRFQVTGNVAATVHALSQLAQDARFGIRLREVQPLPNNWL